MQCIKLRKKLTTGYHLKRSTFTSTKQLNISSLFLKLSYLIRPFKFKADSKIRDNTTHRLTHEPLQEEGHVYCSGFLLFRLLRPTLIVVNSIFYSMDFKIPIFCEICNTRSFAIQRILSFQCAVGVFRAGMRPYFFAEAITSVPLQAILFISLSLKR